MSSFTCFSLRRHTLNFLGGLFLLTLSTLTLLADDMSSDLAIIQAATSAVEPKSQKSLPVLGVLGPAIETIPAEDRVNGHKRFARAVSKAFSDGQYEDLENAAAHLRRAPFVAFADGTPGLAVFYQGLSARYADISTPEAWEAWRSGFDKWAELFPASPTRPVAEAESFTTWAWHHRGGSYAAHVPSAGWIGFVDNLARARELLDRAPRDCPNRFVALMTVAMGQAWEREDHERLYQEVVAKWPLYLPVYQSKTIYLLPRWFGRSGEIAAWARDEVRLNRTGLGQGIYAYIADVASRYTYETKGMVETEGFDWAAIRDGLRELVAVTPRSAHNAFRAAEWAWRLEDKPAALEFFTPLIDKPRGGTLSEGEFAQLKGWLGLDGQSSKALSITPSAIFEMPTSRDGLILSLVATADGNHVIVGDLGGTLTKLTLPALKLVTHAYLDNAAGSMRLSPNGARIAVGMNGYKSEIIELDVKTLRPSRSSRKIEGELNDFAYTKGGGFVCALGSYNIHPSAAVVDASGKSHPMDWLAPGLSFMPHVSADPLTNLAAFTEEGGIPLYNLTEKKRIHHIVAQPGLTPEALVFRSDGRALAYISRARGFPSTLAIAQGPEWSADAALLRPGPFGHLSCIAWSPDHRWVVVGGDSGQIWLWSADGGDAYLIGTNMQWIRALAFSPDSRWLISGSDDRKVRVWDLSQLTLTLSVP